jgi:hypothetical protein
MKEDSAMAARRTITVVEIVAETLLTLAKMLCIVELTIDLRVSSLTGHVGAMREIHTRFGT